MNAITMIIDRDCSVSESNLSVIRHVVSRLRKGHKTFKTMPRKDRREFMRACIKRQEENRQEYNWAMGPH